ncbi:MAG: nitrous oxide reductase accessory protein NosL [Burkholderiaceae bacterium]|jgi:copper chaperone NosL|nr:nitrous oxide reductase accessory protein NosL [Burkholderiaceae bacterium]
MHVTTPSIARSTVRSVAPVVAPSVVHGRLRTKAVALVLAIVAGAFLLAGCDRTQPTSRAPTPNEVLAEATGYYCGMLLADHEGPKGQVHLVGRASPLWFSSVRDTLAFLRLPEEPRDITAVYVNDMARAKNWAQPEPGAWVEAREAWFVIGSDRAGGMGAPEAIPFSREDVAQAFVAQHGGKVARLDGIPDDYVLGAVGAAGAAQTPAGH